MPRRHGCLRGNRTGLPLPDAVDNGLERGTVALQIDEPVSNCTLPDRS